jgi:haloalkane dehalogenase
LIHTRAYFSASHGQLHYRVCGDAQSPPLILLHQTPSDSRMYESLMVELAGDYRLLAPDNPGFGASDALPEGFTVAGCAAAIAALMDDQGIRQAFLFGHHSGACVAVQLACDRPDLVSRLALGGPPLLDDALRSALPASAAPFPALADGSHLLKMWQRMSAKEDDTPPPLLLREVMSAFSAGPAYAQAYAAVIEQDFAGQLAALDCPTLVFAGSRDVLYGRLQAAFDLLRRGSMLELDAAGGYLCDREPQRVAGILRDFFTVAIRGSR